MTAKPNIRRMPNRWIGHARKAVIVAPLPAQTAPASLSDEDRALIALAKQRPVDPAVWREIQRKGLSRYV